MATTSGGSREQVPVDRQLAGPYVRQRTFFTKIGEGEIAERKRILGWEIRTAARWIGLFGRLQLDVGLRSKLDRVE